MILYLKLILDADFYSSLYSYSINTFLCQLTALCVINFIFYDEFEKLSLNFYWKIPSTIFTIFKYRSLKDIYKLSNINVIERFLSDIVNYYFVHSP